MDSEKHQAESGEAKIVYPSILVNLSNFPVEKWEKTQIRASERWESIIDFTLPQIPPNAGTKELSRIGYEIIKNIRKLYQSIPKSFKPNQIPFPSVFLIAQPELCYVLINRLDRLGIPAIYPEAEQIIIRKNYYEVEISGFIGFKPYAQTNTDAWLDTIQWWTASDDMIEKWIDLCPMI